MYIDLLGKKAYPSNFIGPIRPEDTYLDENSIIDEENTQYIDLTDEMDDFMTTNADALYEYKEDFGYVDAAIYFYTNVKDNGDLDIKLQDDWKFDDDKIYLYNGMQLRYDDPGNINFGYVGRVLFNEEILCMGAGINQFLKYGTQFGNLSTWYDDPHDQEMIRYGYQLNRWDYN